LKNYGVIYVNVVLIVDKCACFTLRVQQNY